METRGSTETGGKKIDYRLILPVLFLEYLSISLGKTLFPNLIVKTFGDYSYIAVGLVETLKGLLAFVACPVFGKLSDIIGRKYCILVTVIGSTMPVCLMAFNTDMYVYSLALAVSGFFSATFSLTFAYISDCVSPKDRAPSYGMALATFGLSFVIGPVIGSYVNQAYEMQSVFLASLVLVIANVFYIILFLPETVNVSGAMDATTPYQKMGVAMKYIPNSWSFWETFDIFGSDPFLSSVAVIVFIYYTSVWAIISTFMLYITAHLNFTPVSLGWLMATYGMATIFSEAALVRIIVPKIGEVNSMRLGLLAFSMQCIVVAMGTTPGWIYFSVFFSMFANLFYPSVSSLVSKIVPEEQQGEALGALNGIKALTEGFGPLLFGIFMALYNRTPMPGAPYIVAGMLSFWAFLHCYELPDQPDEMIAKFHGKNKAYDHPARALLSMCSDGEASE